MNRRTFLGAFTVTLCFVLIFGCGDDGVEPVTGFLTVAVYDQGDPSVPVAGVEIRIVPSSLASDTNESGEAQFELTPGDYFVNAAVCCAGPGLVEYHEAVSVVEGQTAEVVLPACLACVCKPALLH